MRWTEEQVRALHREHIEDDVSLAELGGRFGISREAMRQQFAKYALARSPLGHHSAQARREHQRRAEEQRERIIDLYKEYGTIRAVLAHVKLPRSVVAPIIATIPNRESYRRRGKHISYSRDELRRALRRAADYAGEPLTIPGYRIAARELGLPSYETYVRHYYRDNPDSPWAAALADAGVKANESRGRRPGSIRPDDCVEAVIRYIQDHGGERGSYTGYCAWADGKDVPAGPTVRSVYPWGLIVDLALDKLNSV